MTQAIDKVQTKERPILFSGTRKASRILLQVADIRVQRLQDISKDDAIAEGVPPFNWDDGSSLRPIDAFIKLWDSINADRGYEYALNPWVWAVGFKRIEQQLTQTAEDVNEIVEGCHD